MDRPPSDEQAPPEANRPNQPAGRSGDRGLEDRDLEDLVNITGESLITHLISADPDRSIRG